MNSEISRHAAGWYSDGSTVAWAIPVMNLGEFERHPKMRTAFENMVIPVADDIRL